MHPTHGIGGVAEALDNEDFRHTLHPGAAIVSGGADRKTRITEGWILANEIRQGTTASFAKCGVTVGPGWLEGHRTKLVAIGRVDDFSCQGLGFGDSPVVVGFADRQKGFAPAVLRRFHFCDADVVGHHGRFRTSSNTIDGDGRQGCCSG